jgi:hypothetical protein
MFCRIDILSAKRIIHTRYWSGASQTALEEAAERERRRLGGDSVRLRNLHTDEVKLVSPDECLWEGGVARAPGGADCLTPLEMTRRRLQAIMRATPPADG